MDEQPVAVSEDGPVWLADLSWPEAGARAAAGALLAVPIGSTEQHGPHLPLSTDTDIAVALCERLSARCSKVVIAPPVAYGSSGEHAGFAGTLSIGQEALEFLLIELGRSAADTFSRLLFVSAHGGNHDAVTRAVQRLRDESRDVALFVPRWTGDPHAGRVETSLQLALDSQRVRLDEAVAGDVRPLPEILPALRAGGVRAVSASGVLGDPTGATKQYGMQVLADLTDSLIDQVTAWLAEPGER